MSAKFGPAGNSISFTEMGYKHSLQVPEYLEKMGLNAFEYQCGRGVNIGLDKGTDIQNSDDLVDRCVVHGKTREVRLDDLALQLLYGRMHVESDNIVSHGHDVLDGGARKLNSTLKYLGALLVDNSLLLDRLDKRNQLLLGVGGLFSGGKKHGKEL